MRSLRVAVLLAVATLGLAGMAEAPLRPSADAVAPGWQLVSTQSFAGTALGSQWGAYGGVYSIGSSAWSPDDVSVSGGMLHVKMERRTTAGKPYTSGGAAMWGFAQTYGRYEFRAQAPTTAGIDSYITLWPPDSNSDADATLIELLAKPAVSPGKEAAYLTIGYGGGKMYATVPGHYTDGFHDYVIEWTPDYESISVDGVVLLRSTQVTHVRRWIGFIMSNGDTLTGTPSADARLPAEFLVEDLRIYAYVSSVVSGGASATKQVPGSTTVPSKPTAILAPTNPTDPTKASSGAPKPGSTTAVGSVPSAGGATGAVPVAATTTAQKGVSTSTVLILAVVIAAVGLAAVRWFVTARPTGRRARR